MALLFVLLHEISVSKECKTDAEELAKKFALPLQSKRYLFNQRTAALDAEYGGSAHEHYEHIGIDDAEHYEENFERMVKLLILYAIDLFPNLRAKKFVKWDVSALIVEQGQEVELHVEHVHLCSDGETHY